MSAGSAPALDRRKVAAARLAATRRLPYLASGLFASAVVPAPGSGTIAVDRRWNIYADPARVAELDVDQLARLLIHLAGHLIRGHARRADHAGVERGKTGGRWNRCADAEINDDLARDELVPAVAPDLPESIGCRDNHLVEDYFTAASDGPRHWDCGSGCDGIPRSWDCDSGLDHNDCELLCLSVAAEIHRHHRRLPGTVAGGWLRWAEQVLPSRTDWRRALAAEVRSGLASIAGNVDYTYRRPSRRNQVTPGIILPSLHRPLPDVAIVCDTSGSMHQELLARAMAEVEGILTRAGLRQRQLRVLAVDTAVHAVKRVSRATEVVLAGGGGTDMSRGIDAAAALRPRPSIVVVLTDGYTPWPSTAPKGLRVVIGLLVDRGGYAHPEFSTPEWARTIRIEPDLVVSGLGR